MRHETCARTAAATPVLLEFLVHKFTFHWHIFFQDENSGEKFINVKKGKEEGGKGKIGRMRIPVQRTLSMVPVQECIATQKQKSGPAPQQLT